MCVRACVCVCVRVCVRVCVCVCVLHCPLREIWVTLPGKAQQPQEQRYPLLSVCAVFLCVQTMVWLDRTILLYVYRSEVAY